eukprot:scaffold629_cov140-Cylindrotheca_fusiformis.AAC.4
MRQFLLSLLLVVVVWIPLWVSSFQLVPTTTTTSSTRPKQRQRQGSTSKFAPLQRKILHKTNTYFLFGASQDDETTTDNKKQGCFLNWGLLLSSFSDGLVPNEKAQNFLMNGLVQTLWRDRKYTIEQRVEQSALVSSCCGPTDINSLNEMLDATTTEETEEKELSWQESLKALMSLQSEQEEEESSSLSSLSMELRLVYIPTAMYALRKDSNNTPGKQRQRARADGKKRRNEIVQLLKEKVFVGQKVNILSVTLDFDDGSIKQPEGSKDRSKFPSNGKEALDDWKPNLIYVQGGNTFWLYHCIEKGNWKDILTSAVMGKDAAVYCGTSAGAIIAGSSMETATWKGWDDPSVVPDRPTYKDWADVRGLSLAGDISIFPHMDDTWTPLVEEKISEWNESKNIVRCLWDEDVLCIDGRRRTVQELSTKQAPYENATA